VCAVEIPPHVADLCARIRQILAAEGRTMPKRALVRRDAIEILRTMMQLNYYLLENWPHDGNGN